MKHTIEVEVPDGMEPYEVLRMSTYGDIGANYQVRFRPIWQYPEWLGGAGVAMDASGAWHVFDVKPWISATDPWNRWCGEGKMVIQQPVFPLWSPPPCTDWRESWRPNPKWKGE